MVGKINEMVSKLDEAVSAIGWSVKVVKMISITCETVSILTCSELLQVIDNKTIVLYQRTRLIFLP